METVASVKLIKLIKCTLPKASAKCVSNFSYIIIIWKILFIILFYCDKCAKNTLKYQLGMFSSVLYAKNILNKKFIYIKITTKK